MCDCLRSVSLVWILASVCVCACGLIVSSVGFWGDSRVARRAADEDGWMNVNISFTLLSQRLGWFICLRRCCHLACLMCTPTLPTDGSFRVPPPSLISVFGKCSKRAHASLPRHANVHLWHEWTSGFICNCILHWDKWCFSKTSTEKQVQKCGLTLLVAHYKWFLSAGGVPSSPCHLLFSPTNCLFCCFYLSPSFKRALTHTQLPSHFVSLCFNLVKDRNRCERGSHLYALSSADQCWNPPGFLCSVCRVCCLPCCTYIGHDFDRIRWDSRGKGRPIRVARVTSLFPWEASSRQTQTRITFSWYLLPRSPEIMPILGFRILSLIQLSVSVRRKNPFLES